MIGEADTARTRSGASAAAARDGRHGRCGGSPRGQGHPGGCRHDHVIAQASVLPSGASSPAGSLVRRVLFVVLLCAAAALPHLSSGAFEFPGVAHAWVVFPLAALMVLPLVDLARPRRLVHLDLFVLLVPVTALSLERPQRAWPVLMVYPALAYLCARMLMIARSTARAHSPAWTPPASGLSRHWLLLGVAVLAAVHVSWALQGRANNDSAEGAVHGASRILAGKSLYGAAATIPSAPHGDVYGPVIYEAYVPFAAAFGARDAARVTTLFFELVVALLLFILGRRIRGPAAGVLLAYCWLAFPLTLYEDALAFNDAIVASALLASVLMASSPARRGAMTALAVWSKLSPLALLPLLVSHQGGARGAGGRRLRAFAAGFALLTALAFLPALAHGTAATFLSRTLGFQGLREPADSLWGTLQVNYGVHAPWIAVSARVAHGVLIALAGALCLLAFRIRRREDAIGLAAMSAAVLIAVQACLSYYAYGYILWFAPLVLLALLHDGATGAAADPVPRAPAQLPRPVPRGRGGRSLIIRPHADRSTRIARGRARQGDRAR
jgi:hypothetical protein